MTYLEFDTCTTVGGYVAPGCEPVEFLPAAQVMFGTIAARTPSTWTTVLRKGSVLVCAALAALLTVSNVSKARERPVVQTISARQAPPKLSPEQARGAMAVERWLHVVPDEASEGSDPDYGF